MTIRAFVTMLATAILALPLFPASAATSTAPAAAPAAEQAQAREIFRTIIGMRTVASQGQVPVLANYLEQQFRSAGFAADDIHVLPLGETASLVVRYRGDGTGGRPILVLAHMDVVEAKREDWVRDPFTLTEENGYFFGRGTTDVKGDVATIVTTFLRLKAEGFVPKRDLIIAFSGDEETEMLTTRSLVGEHRALLGDPEYALNSDGGGGLLREDNGAAGLIYYVQGAEKTFASFDLTIRNPGGHSSEPRLDNAIYQLADALKAIQAYRFPVMWNAWTISTFRAQSQVTPGPVGGAMKRFAENPRDTAAADVLYGEPLLVGMTRTTCIPTMLKGGHAENALPQSATVTINCRIFPGTSPDKVQATLAKLAGPKVEFKSLTDVKMSDASPMRDDIMSAAAKAVHASYPGIPIVPTMAAYATDGSIFRGAGIPTYGVGAAFYKGSEDFQHGLDERVRVAAFYAELTHWHVLLTELAGR
jgi:acetylornithine deacetylase/succinyl-diaminopimelate desuccinylase-like protein